MDFDRFWVVVIRFSLILLDFANVGNPTGKTSKTNNTNQMNKMALDRKYINK